MSALLPLQAARELQGGISEYLSTTFALADARAQKSLTDFVGDRSSGMFQGPFVRTRMPFAPAAKDESSALDWTPSSFPFVPYVHQAQAFARLSSRPDEGSTVAWRRPEPTLVVTGTGSGKTEAFLYPVLDHAKRARSQGVRGVKALLLYPMNALATDQAERLTRLLLAEPGLAGVTAGIYTGEHQGSGRTTVSEAGLITDRATIREDPPDLLLTNYKMLDQLLLRPEDADVWRISAEGLQYVVLDEFHTYDGAQGTDVALLLRRLGLVVGTHLAPTDGGRVLLTDADRDRPLGRITPVATSATLGDDGDTGPVREFARTVFGEEFPAEAVLTESRLTVDQWMLAPDAERVPVEDVASPARMAELDRAIAERLDDGEDPAEAIFAAVCTDVWGEHGHPDTGIAMERAREHELLARILEHSAHAVSLGDLAVAVLPHVRRPSDAERYLTHVLGALSHMRAVITAADSVAGRRLPSFEAHLWVRELTRLDRAVATSVRFRWHDDGPDALPDDAGEAGSLSAEDHLPAIFCRHCGRAGWMTAYEPGTETPQFAAAAIRKSSIADRTTVRALIAADQEVDAALAEGMPLSEVRGSRDSTTSLMWLNPAQTRLLAAESVDPTTDADPRIVPVLLHTGATAKEISERETCPACGTRDSIRYIGSAVATLLSVALSNLFGTTGLDAADKRTLVFSDSVQDASHRAGFVQARAHAFALRTATTTALAGGSLSLTALARAVRDQAQTPVQRYHLLHPSLADRTLFTPFWDTGATSSAKGTATKAVGDRLLFDLSLEFGLRSTLGRTLALTGSAVATVDAPTADLVDAARGAWEATTVESALSEAEPDDHALEVWARVMIRRILQRGGITHRWLTEYARTDGNTWHLFKRQARAKGVPGFPIGAYPAFPRVGSTLAKSKYVRGMDPVAQRQSWYERWTSRHLGVTPDSAQRLAATLMARLAEAGVLELITTESGASVYGLSPDSVIVTAEPEPGELRCDVCHNTSPAVASVRDLLTGAPCLTVDCPGRLATVSIDADNYYRRLYHSADSRAVVAREHTSLLETKDRARIEAQFKTAADEPGAPNVLVATPTLEMGIDIGDLSSVMLSSLPDSVASYVQRVGRAGRLTGNSLVVALVRGRGKTLPVVHDPLSLINGSVQPPAAFLSAAEILRRQFLAHAIDALVLECIHPDGTRARDVLKKHADCFVPRLRIELPGRVPALLEQFLGSLGEYVSEAAASDLREWATGETSEGDPAPRSLDSTLALALDRWNDETAELTRRLDRLDTVLVDLRERAQSPGASDQDHEDLRAAEASHKATIRQRQQHMREYWISALERLGLLPGYQLLDDTVDLHTSVSSQDPETSEWSVESTTFTRSVASALTELAPGNSFYADRMRIEISSVDMGADRDEVERWRVCPACSHAETVVTDTVGACPSCGAAGFADSAQVLDVVPLRRVAAQVSRDSATVDERHDERLSRRYTVARTLTFRTEDGAGAWFVDGTSLGAHYLRRADIRWINLGTGPGASRMIGGNQPAAPHFRLCEYCGHIDPDAGRNTRRNHRPWCAHADSPDEHNVHVALGRTLHTEGVLLYLPSTVSTYDTMILPSLVAALKLGFRRALGGDPSHLEVGTVTVPLPGKPSTTTETTTAGPSGPVPALLLHDSVPGGTGYLAGFTSPEDVWSLLHTAWSAVRDCPCAAENRLACPECLLPHSSPADVDRTSRATAETALLDLLCGEGRDDEAVPRFEDWSIVEFPTFDPQGDSALEVRFRHRLSGLLKDAGAKVDTIPAGKYSALRIRVPGSQVTWDLLAQVDLPGLGTRPDYLLQPDDPNLPKFAIYADGAKYHASPEYNRVADDADKREAARDMGWIPWAVTHADLDEAEIVAAPPAWPQQNYVKAFATSLGLAPTLVNAASGDPVTLLTKIVTDPDPRQWQDVGHACAAYGLASGVRDGAARIVSRPFSRLAVSGNPRQAASIWADLVIDSSDAAVGSASYREDWQWWLRWSNLLSLRPGGSRIYAADGLDTGVVDVEAELAAMVDEVAAEPTASATAPETPADPGFSGAWREIAEEIDPEDPDSTAELDVLRMLAEMGAPLPDYGEEVRGVIANYSWPEAKVALFVSQSPDTVRPIADAGWTVIDWTAEPESGRLREALGTPGGEEC
ncbi:DEAD/DEAH box helicase [Dietzia kunjamensis]|uniref:DEAD/DEAH box helicase n=1 Tax=Dietzia kunjamensis TaxID=322509 RepID=UPI002DBD9E14|nr:DEAD/DEAH box helicase [Dietzia kunjamensis]MEB8324545.1 DEAD/DEAH box helicase [Dietzia kunjamensis]